jgi:uracil-DNA glycosylase
MKTILFIGQAPAKPTSKHEIPGTYLHTWLHSIGMNDSTILQSCHFYALVDAFPGSSKSGHKTPSPEQMKVYRPKLEAMITLLQPDIVVPVGKMAITEILQQKDAKLIDVVGEKYVINLLDTLKRPIPCVPFSHPSGRSVWNATHKEQVRKALNLLENEIGG